MKIKIFLKRTFRYLIPLIILSLFIIPAYHSHYKRSVVEQEMLSLKEFSILAQKQGNFRLSFLDSLLLNIIDFILPGQFIYKKASLELLDQKKREVEVNTSR